jgi:hypothetical protein
MTEQTNPAVELRRLRADLDRALGLTQDRPSDSVRIAALEHRLELDAPAAVVERIDRVYLDALRRLHGAEARRFPLGPHGPWPELTPAAGADEALDRLDGLLDDVLEDATAYRDLLFELDRLMPCADDWDGEEGELQLYIWFVQHLARWAEAANDGEVPPRHAVPADLAELHAGESLTPEHDAECPNCRAQQILHEAAGFLEVMGRPDLYDALTKAAAVAGGKTPVGRALALRVLGEPLPAAPTAVPRAD